MKKTYRGSCHCRRVTFEVDLDLAAGTNKCNCTFCWKHRWWTAIAKPEALRPLTGLDELTRYPPAPSDGPRGFCRYCGVVPFVSYDKASWNDGAYVSVNLACLEDLPATALAEAPVQYLDGRNDAWGTPAETRHL